MLVAESAGAVSTGFNSQLSNTMAGACSALSLRDLEYSLLQCVLQRRMVGHMHFQAAALAHLEYCFGHRPLTGPLLGTGAAQ